VCQQGNVIAPLALRLPYGANISESAPQGKRSSTFRVVKDGQEVPPSELPVQKAAASGQEVRESEITVVFDDGTAREMLGNAAPLLDREGKVRGAIGVLSTSPNTSGRSQRCRSRRPHWLAWRRS
jgi:two-component system CheB/CheR fusion protein